VMARAQKIVGSLDRSALGSFASSPEALTYALAVRIAVVGRMSNLYRLLKRKSTLEYALAHKNVSVEEDATARSEMYFWIQDSTDPAMQKLAASTPYTIERDSSRDRDWSERFSLVRSRPDAHGYFHAGIWDIEFIDRCISDGIDVSMALSIEAG